jgi:hypothetical protein
MPASGVRQVAAGRSAACAQARLKPRPPAKPGRPRRQRCARAWGLRPAQPCTPSPRPPAASPARAPHLELPLVQCALLPPGPLGQRDVRGWHGRQEGGDRHGQACNRPAPASLSASSPSWAGQRSSMHGPPASCGAARRCTRPPACSQPDCLAAKGRSGRQQGGGRGPGAWPGPTCRLRRAQQLVRGPRAHAVRDYGVGAAAQLVRHHGQQGLHSGQAGWGARGCAAARLLAFRRCPPLGGHSTPALGCAAMRAPSHAAGTAGRLAGRLWLRHPPVWLLPDTRPANCRPAQQATCLRQLLQAGELGLLCALAPAGQLHRQHLNLMLPGPLL